MHVCNLPSPKNEPHEASRAVSRPLESIARPHRGGPPGPRHTFIGDGQKDRAGFDDLNGVVGNDRVERGDRVLVAADGLL